MSIVTPEIGFQSYDYFDDKWALVISVSCMFLIIEHAILNTTTRRFSESSAKPTLGCQSISQPLFLVDD